MAEEQNVVVRAERRLKGWRPGCLCTNLGCRCVSDAIEAAQRLKLAQI